MFVTRLAPTPSGFLHKGNAVSFAFTTLLAKTINAKLLLRIDDIDSERVRPEYVNDIFNIIEWLNISIDIGPTSPNDFYQNWSQQSRLQLYTSAIQRLPQENIYACACSRKQLTSCRCFSHKEPENPTIKKAIKLKIDEALIRNWKEYFPQKNRVFRLEKSPINILLRATGLPSYQVASIMDDMLYNVTHIVRGADLIETTAFQHHLAKQLGFTSFQLLHFYHHPLLTDSFGNKLSKSAGNATPISLKNSGVSRSEIWEMAELWIKEIKMTP